MRRSVLQHPNTLEAPGHQASICCCWQVYLRLQWVSRVVRGVVTRLEVGLSGLSLSVAGGLQDELLNLTARQLAVTNVMTTAEFKVHQVPPPHPCLH